MQLRTLIIIILFFAISLFFDSCSILTRDTNKNTKAEKDELEFTYSFFEGNKHKMLGNYDDATAYYLKCLQIDKKSSATMYELANIYVLQGDLLSALMFAEEAVKINPGNLWYNLLLAKLYESRGMQDKAISVYKNIIKDNPDRMDYKLELASLLTSSGKLRDALRIYEEIESRHGMIAEISMKKEDIYLKLGEKEKAYNELNKLIEAYPYETHYYGLLAEIYVAHKQYDKAFEVYQKLLKADPDNGLAHLSLSEYYRITDNPDKSFEELKLAFASQDVNVDMKVKMMLSFQSFSETNRKINDRAYQLLSILEETHGNEPKILALYGDFLTQDEKYKQAREKYRKVLDITKKNYMIWEQLMFIDNTINDYKALYEDSKQAIEYFPVQANFYLFNGIAATKLKKLNKATEILKAGLDLVVDNKNLELQFYIYLAEAYFKAKNNAESDKYFEKALEIDPSNKYVLNNYSYYLSLRGEKLDRALEMAEKCNNIEENNATYLDTYAWVLYKMKNYEKALKVIELSIDNGGGGSAVIIEHKADILYKLGKHEQAVELWKKAKATGRGSEFLEKKIEEEKLIE